MTFVASCCKPDCCASNALLADPINSPNTRAAIVATSPVPSLITSLDSLLRCASGSTTRKIIPTTAPPAAHAKIMTAKLIELTVLLPFPTDNQSTEEPIKLNPMAKNVKTSGLKDRKRLKSPSGQAGRQRLPPGC